MRGPRRTYLGVSFDLVWDGCLARIGGHSLVEDARTKPHMLILAALPASVKHDPIAQEEEET